MKKKYIIDLTEDEIVYLKSIISKGKTNASKIKHANILLAANISTNNGVKDIEICSAYNTTHSTVERIRKQFVEEGLEAALVRKRSKRIYKKLIDGDCEAHLIALACSYPPDGYKQWTMRLLADKMVELNFIDDVSKDTVHRTLKKMKLNPG